MARILVTGAAGFIGRALCPELAARGHRVIAGLRSAGPPVPGAEPRLLGEIGPAKDWSGALDGVEIVVHLAQRAHRRAGAGTYTAELDAASALARAAAAAGVRRLIYMSSVKVMGEATPPGRPFRPDDPPRPETPYGRAKLATERALQLVAAATRLELMILRPPLVYGPDVGANFRALLRLAGSGIPLPFAGIDNRRSFLHLDNLADLVATGALHPAAAGQVLLAADGLDLSTPGLIRLLATGLGRPARLFAVPEAVSAFLRRLPWLGARLSPLTLSLQVDDSATRNALGWTPPVAAEAALLATARSFAAAA